MKKEEYRELTRRVSRMNAKKAASPYEALGDYFDSFTLEDCRNNLWELYERCVMSYAHEKSTHDEAAKMLFFYTHTEMLVEAAWLLNNKRKRKSGITEEYKHNLKNHRGL